MRSKHSVIQEARHATKHAHCPSEAGAQTSSICTADVQSRVKNDAGRRFAHGQGDVPIVRALPVPARGWRFVSQIRFQRRPASWILRTARHVQIPHTREADILRADQAMDSDLSGGLTSESAMKVDAQRAAQLASNVAAVTASIRAANPTSRPVSLLSHS